MVSATETLSTHRSEHVCPGSASTLYCVRAKYWESSDPIGCVQGLQDVYMTS